MFSFFALSAYFFLAISWLLIKKKSLHTAFLYSFLSLFSYIYVIIEILSGFNLIYWQSIWTAVILPLLVLLILVWKNKNLVISKWIQNWQQIKKLFAEHSVVMLALSLLFVTLFIFGVFIPPNNYDSMTYHLPRVLHWITNHSVEYYFTNISRQNFVTPLPEFMLIFIRLLDKSFRFAFLVQFLSFLTLPISASLIAKHYFDLGTKKQLLAAFLAATAPMTILQSITTQTDVTAAAFVMIAVYMFLIHHDFAFQWSSALALLAKSTAGFYLFAFVLWHLFLVVKTKNWKLAVSGLFFLLIISPQFIRNQTYYGNLLGPNNDNNIIKIHKPVDPLESFVMNTALHFQTTNQNVNNNITGWMIKIFRGIGEDLGGEGVAKRTFVLHYQIFHHDFGHAQIHMILVVAALIIAFVHKDKKRNKYAVLVALAYVLLASLIVWSPWRGRYFVGFFAMAAPLVAVVLRRQQWQNFILLLLIIWSSVVIFKMEPVTPGWKLLNYKQLTIARFKGKTNYQKIYDQLQDVASPVKVGLVIGPDEWEYPLWYVLNEARIKIQQFDHLEVENFCNLKYRGQYDLIFVTATAIMNKPDCEANQITCNSYWCLLKDQR